jgi:hypothetical protein
MKSDFSLASPEVRSSGQRENRILIIELHRAFSDLSSRSSLQHQNENSLNISRSY